MNTKTNLYEIEDPTSPNGFLTDYDNNVYFNDTKKKIYCQFHTRTQLKQNEGWLYCAKCDNEVSV